MPCYQVTTCSTELGEHTDEHLLEEALKEEGYEIRKDLVRVHSGQLVKDLAFSKADQQIFGTFKNGRLNVTAPRTTKVDTDAIKRSYSKQVIKAKAKKHGFKVEARPGNKFILSKMANRM